MDNKEAKEFRKSKFINQADFGLLLGMPQASWSRIESGKIRMTEQQKRSIEILQVIAESGFLDNLIGILKNINKQETEKMNSATQFLTQHSDLFLRRDNLYIAKDDNESIISLIENAAVCVEKDMMTADEVFIFKDGSSIIRIDESYYSKEDD